MKDISVRKLAEMLQQKIDTLLESFIKHNDTLKAMTEEMENIEKKMMIIVTELEPVESLIYNQNPQLKKIFESLKRVHGQEYNGIDTDIN